MHIFIVYNMPLSLAHTIQSNFRSSAGWRLSGLIQVLHENLLTGIDKNHDISRLYTLGPVWHSQGSSPKYKSETYPFKPASSVFYMQFWKQQYSTCRKIWWNSTVNRLLSSSSRFKIRWTFGHQVKNEQCLIFDMFHIPFYITVEIISEVYTPSPIKTMTKAAAFVLPNALLQAHATLV